MSDFNPAAFPTFNDITDAVAYSRRLQRVREVRNRAYDFIAIHGDEWFAALDEQIEWGQP